MIREAPNKVWSSVVKLTRIQSIEFGTSGHLESLLVSHLTVVFLFIDNISCGLQYQPLAIVNETDCVTGKVLHQNCFSARVSVTSDPLDDRCWCGARVESTLQSHPLQTITNSHYHIFHCSSRLWVTFLNLWTIPKSCKSCTENKTT